MNKDIGHIKEKLSAVIVCQNEEKMISKCLESVKWADEILVVDAFSSDNTVRLCKKYTDRVIQRAWTNYPDQLNYGIQHAAYNRILFIDSDERVLPELKDEIIRLLSSGKMCEGYIVSRKTYYAGGLLKFRGKCNTIRFFDKTKVEMQYDRMPHERIKIHGRISRLKGKIAHFPFETFEEHFRKVDSYSLQSAKKLFERKPNISELELVFRMLIEPWPEVFRRLVLRLGILDGIPMILIIFLSAFEKILIYARYWGLKNK